MLYYAAHMQEDGEIAPQATRKHSYLRRYVEGWKRETDMRCIALEPATGQSVGAAWLRLLIGDDKTLSYVDDLTPKLAIAVLPNYIGSGVGTQLLNYMLEAASAKYATVVLNVRANNPARRLYESNGVCCDWRSYQPDW
jgi:ribosomal protein S18 acetylase RimI-like enzyme